MGWPILLGRHQRSSVFSCPQFSDTPRGLPGAVHLCIRALEAVILLFPVIEERKNNVASAVKLAILATTAMYSRNLQLHTVV